MARTKVYRILDNLIEKQLVIQQCGSSGFKFTANDPSQLDLLLSLKEKEFSTLRASLPKIIQKLENKIGSNNSSSQILYYRGKQGLSQVNWNLLNAKDEFLSFEVSTAEAYMPQQEAEQLRAQLLKHKIMVRTITNKKVIEPFTQVSGLVEHWWKIRHIPTSTLSIQTDIFIYNNVYTVCHYLDDGDIFCFEIHNKHLAKMQKAIFENLWKQAKVMKIVNKQGKAILV